MEEAPIEEVRLAPKKNTIPMSEDYDKPKPKALEEVKQVAVPQKKVEKNTGFGGMRGGFLNGGGASQKKPAP